MGALRWWAHQQSPWYLSLRSGAGLWGCQCACGVSAAVCLLALLDVCFYWGTHNRKWPQLFKKTKQTKKQPTICHILLRDEDNLTSWASQPNFLHLEHQVRKHRLVCWWVQRLKLVMSDDLSSHLGASWASAPSFSSSVPAARWR